MVVEMAQSKAGLMVYLKVDTKEMTKANSKVRQRAERRDSYWETC